MLVYNALIQPHFDYCCEVWDELGKGLGERLQKFQNRAARLMNFEHVEEISLRFIQLKINSVISKVIYIFHYYRF